jgi:molecular chaperone GrpE
MNRTNEFEQSKENQPADDASKNVDNGHEAVNEAVNVEANAEEAVQEQSPEEKMADLENKYLRLVAEFDNYRKRTARERLEFLAVAGEDIIKGLLPVLDDFERALQAMSDAAEVKAIHEGVELIYNKLFKYLETRGLKQIEAEGKDLNTDEHDAVTKFPAPSDDRKGKVIDVLQHGYTLNGKVIRYAKVVVGE